jgi:ribokinase
MEDKTENIYLIGLGSMTMDYILCIDKIIGDYETIIKDEAVPTPGGAAANTIVGVAKLGLKTGLIGIVGEDEDGKRLIEEINSLDIDPHYLAIEKDPRLHTGRVIVLAADNGERTMLVNHGINRILTENILLKGKHINDLIYYINDAGALHISSFPDEKQFSIIKHILRDIDDKVIIGSTPLFYSKKGLDYLESLLLRTDMIFLYENQFEELMKRHLPTYEKWDLKYAINRFFDWRKNNNANREVLLAIKSKLQTKTKNDFPYKYTLYIGKKHLENVITPNILSKNAKLPGWRDLTGAGDSFATGVWYGRLNHSSFQEMANFGYCLALLTSSMIGARTGFAKLSTVIKFYSRLYGEFPKFLEKSSQKWKNSLTGAKTLEIGINWSNIDSQKFEKMCTELLSINRRVQNVRHVGGPGDKGRDIILEEIVETMFGKEINKVVIQCKHLKNSITASRLPDIPKYDHFHKADKYLVLTSNYFTPQAIELMEIWNSDPNYHFNVYWYDGDIIERLLAENPQILKKYFEMAD